MKAKKDRVHFSHYGIRWPPGRLFGCAKRSDHFFRSYHQLSPWSQKEVRNLNLLCSYQQPLPRFQRGIGDPNLFCSHQQLLLWSQRGVGNIASIYNFYFICQWLWHPWCYTFQHWIRRNGQCSLAWISLAFWNKGLNTGCSQSMRIYIGSNLVYGFNKRRTFRPGYMARNTRSSQEHRGHDENSMGKGDSLSAKGKWDLNLLVVPLWQGGKVYESTYFLLYDYWAVELA